MKKFVDEVIKELDRQIKRMENKLNPLYLLEYDNNLSLAGLRNKAYYEGKIAGYESAQDKITRIFGEYEQKKIEIIDIAQLTAKEAAELLEKFK